MEDLLARILYLLGSDYAGRVSAIATGYLEGQATIMADLTNLSAALDQLGTELASLTTDVEAKLTSLIDEIHTLTAGQITQEQIDALTAKATAVEQSAESLDAAAQAAQA